MFVVDWFFVRASQGLPKNLNVYFLPVSGSACICWLNITNLLDDMWIRRPFSNPPEELDIS